MENNNENNGFQYTYSAKEQEELKRIREKYTEKADSDEDKMARIRRLDNGVVQKATAFSIAFGIVGTLIMGLGMSLVMTDLAEKLGFYHNVAFICGIIIGVLGGILVSLAYPIYNAVIKRERKKIAPEIIKLTDDLIK